MIRKVFLQAFGRLTPAAGIFTFGEDQSAFDVNRLDAPPGKKPETGMERVKAMFRSDEFGEPSLELHHVAQSSLTGAFIGACYGGFINTRLAYLYFIENNQATIFKSTNEAKKKLQDFVTISFARGAVKWGWRLGVFTGMFSFTAAVISAYRGDTTILQYVAAGTITGALYKANLGLAASFVGAGLGAVLSAIGGLLIFGILKITGFSMDDIRRALHSIKEAREEQWNKAVAQSSEITNDSLTKHHDQLIEEKGEIPIEKI